MYVHTYIYLFLKHTLNAYNTLIVKIYMYLCVERLLHKFVNCYFYMQCLATKIVSNIEQNFPLACEKFCMTLPLFGCTSIVVN